MRYAIRLGNSIDNVNEKRERERKRELEIWGSLRFSFDKDRARFITHGLKIKNRSESRYKNALHVRNRTMYSYITEFWHALIGKPDINSSFLEERNFAVGINAFTLYVQKLPVMNNNMNYTQFC